MKKELTACLSLIILIFLLSACSFEQRDQATYYVIDPRFDELYEQLQGREVLGPPISNKKFVAGTNLEKQYFESAVMVYDPDSSPRYYLEPIGYEAGFTDLPNVDPENPNVRYVNGYIIPLEFAKVYDELGGSRWVGKPLTRARKNPEKGTVEQYFENLGFFRFEDDPPGTVRLMPYGLWKCAGECSKYPNVKNASAQNQAMETQQSPFTEVLSRLGSKFTGGVLSEPYRAADRSVEQIFENVVLYQDRESPMGVSLRPVVTILGLAQDPYQEAGQDSTMYFREVEPGKGYYIPTYFIDFVSRYSGFELSGEPVTRLRTTEEGWTRQCFENYCLIYDQTAPEPEVSLQPLGVRYQEQTGQSQPAPTTAIQEQRNFVVDVWEQSQQISSLEEQQFGACIHEGDLAITGVSGELKLSTPRQGLITYQLPKTDQGGCSFLTADPVQAKNGTTIDYQVCFQGVKDEPICKKDSFLIWGNAEGGPSLEPTAAPADQGNQGFVLDIWELSPQIPSHEAQEVGACLHQDDQPLVNYAAELMVNTPEEGILLYKASPTDQGGCSFFKLEPIEARNGETIPYQVCFIDQQGEKFCQRDSFLIWGNP